MTGPETENTAEPVHDLLRDQHPDLAGPAVREVAGGWDNRMWRLGDEPAVRMPRTEQPPDLQREDCRWLPPPLRPCRVRSRTRYGPVNRPRASRCPGPS